MKVKKYMIIGILLIILGIFIYFKFVRINPNTTFETTKIKISDQIFDVEIAKTPSQLSLGLGNRQSLCSNCGMIFVYPFPFEGSFPFWMKDTLIPLDMIWINSQNQVVTIQTAQPEINVADNNLKQYQNNQPARYVIELNAGDSNKLNLKIGDIITIPNL